MNDPVLDKLQTLGENLLTHVKAASKDQVIELLNEAFVEVLAERAAQDEAVVRIVESMNGMKVKFALLGAAAGAAAGAMAAFAVAYRRAEAKFHEVSDNEIQQMKEHFDARRTALEADLAKPAISDIVKEKGYSSPDADVSDRPPMAVAPPRSVVEAAEEEEAEESKVQNVFEQAEPTHEWDWDTERKTRRAHRPYVVHYDEKDDDPAYSDVTLTYYEGDDVLCDERDGIIAVEDRDRMVGEKNLERFGHGSNDVNVVYIRNDQLEILWEVVKSPNSYAEEVHGFKRGDITHEGYDRQNLRRMRARERDLDEN